MSNDWNNLPPAPATGLSDNVAGGLAYLTIIPAIIFLVLAPYSQRPFVRFNSFQCIFLFVASVVARMFHIIPFIGWAISLILGLTVVICWIIALVHAFQGKKFLAPVVGPLAEQAASSF